MRGCDTPGVDKYQHIRTERPRTCFTATGAPKQRFATRASAEVSRAQLTRGDTKRVEVYECPNCPGFHIGKLSTAQPLKS